MPTRDHKSKSGKYLVVGMFVLGAMILAGFFYAAHKLPRTPVTAPTLGSGR
jgi:hypothetical protein